MDKDVVCMNHTREYCSAIKKNEIFLSATTQVGLEGVILGKANQDKCFMISQKKTETELQIQRRGLPEGRELGGGEK